MPTKAILPNPDFDQKLTYSPGIEVTGAARTLYISGQVGVDAHGVIPAGITEQSQLVWANMLAVLTAAGMGVGNIVKLTTFLTAADDFPAFVQVRSGVLGAHKPASTLLIVAGLAKPEWKVEVEAIAVA